VEAIMAGRMTIDDRDLRTILSIVSAPDDGHAAYPMPVSVLTGLRQLIRCENVTFVSIDARRRTIDFEQEVGEPGLTGTEREAWNAAFWTHYWDSPPCCYPDTSRDLASVTTISDFHSDRQYHATSMYRECLRLESVERMMTLCLPGRLGRAPRLVFFREHGPDFSPRDRALLTLLRPNLHTAYRTHRHRQLDRPELTSRQWELLRLVAGGHTNRQIGRRLSISEATVRKHLEHIFERLQVDSRTAAVTRAFGIEAGTDLRTLDLHDEGRLPR
jgi:DNA-binding CsgD family transcriptional regulator